MSDHAAAADVRTAHPNAAVDLVLAFFAEVWQSPYNLDAIDELVTEDFVITSGGADVQGRRDFKEWVRAFHRTVHDLELRPVESFQSADGSRVASRWELTGRNNGFAGTEPDGRAIHMTGTAVWAVREDGLLAHNWVERNAFELFQQLTAKA